MAGRHDRNLGGLLGLGAVVLLAAWIAGCGGNSTAVGITVTGPTASPVDVLLNGNAQFSATVTGISTTSVFWQICLPAVSTTIQPTNCTVPNPPTTGATVPKTPLTGYGTVTGTGFYSAPSQIPAQNSFVIMASSTAQPTAFGIITVNLDSGIVVNVLPATVTIGPNETYQFTATVSGLPSNAVTWSVPAPPVTNGSISPSGLYQAPNTGGHGVAVMATSTADPSKNGTASVTVGPGGPPVLTSLDPAVAAQGSAQQDVYLNGSNFLSTSVAEVAGVPVPTTFITTTLLRTTIPAAQLTQAGVAQVTVVTQSGNPNAPGPLNLNIFAVRPAIVASAPDSVAQNAANATVNLTGGFFVPGGVTSATFQGAGVAPTLANSRQMSIPVPAGPLVTPGLYPIVVQNSGVAAGQPSKAAVNLGVTPVPGSIPTAPTATGISVGVSPSAVAVDQADGLAVVANSGSNTVSLISMATHLPVGAPIAVGTNPTGVAVDDLLPDAVALVVNKLDQTVTAIDLITGNTATLSVQFDHGANPPLPIAIGVNPVTHRAIVAYQSTNQATVLDVSDAAGVPILTVVQQVGGSETSFTTGADPAVAIDPRLNWAVITPGGAGNINLVDLGVDVSADEPKGRTPQVVGSLSIAPTVQGVAVNPETHQALFADPTLGTLTTFSLLDDTVTLVTANTMGGGIFSEAGFDAVAASPLENVAVAVNELNKSAVVVDLENAVVLQTVSGIGSNSVLPAVAVDPTTNQAVVVNQQDNAVEIVSLGSSIPPINPLQITESRPVLAFGGPGAPNLALTIDGSGFNGGSQVQLDGTAVPITSVAANGRQIVASVPGGMLGSARRYFVQVSNGGGAVTNVAYLTVVQPIPVGKNPVAVAVDTDRDLVVATNSGDGNVSLISLAAPSPESPESLGPVGLIGLPVTVGTTPEGVAVLPRLGVAVVANNGSNNATVVDLTGVNIPVTASACSAGTCSSATAVAMNQDAGVAAVTSTNSSQNGNPAVNGTVGFITNLATATPGTASIPVDQDPIAAAIDPGLNLAAIATASSASSVDLVDTATDSLTARAFGGTLQNPSGVVFDPLNQIFVVANSLVNNVVFIDPNTFIQTSARVGINPTSIDYNFQASTLVTVNSSVNILSILDYVCPPNVLLPACTGPRVRDVLGIGGVQSSSFVLGPNAIAIDPKLNLGALVDPDNDRVLLVPLPR